MPIRNRKTNEQGINWTGSSEHLKKAIDLTKIMRQRMVIMAVCICLFMSLILGRLISVQFIQNEQYRLKLEAYTKSEQKVTTPRGEILDRTGQVLVGNRQRLNITYFPPLEVSNVEEWNLAYQFAQDFHISSEELRVRDLKDLYLTIHASGSDTFKSWVKKYGYSEYEDLFNDEKSMRYKSLITEEEMDSYYAGNLDDNDIYYLKLSRIESSDYEEFDETLRAAWLIKQLMDVATGGQTKNILSDVTKEEVAFLTEHSERYPGFDVEIDWDRQYPFGSTLKSVFGSVTTSKQGLPADGLDHYLALGYSRNEKVGRSGIELQYESMLAGERKVYSLSYDEQGKGILTETTHGRIGYDLETAIDIHLQLETEKILAEILNRHKDDPTRQYMDRISVVVMDPNNGDVLTLASMVRNDDSIIADPVSTYTMAYEPGSVVKGAVIYMGQSEGVIRSGEKMNDQPIKLKGTATKSSWKNLGWIDDIQALAQSSNIYMILTAIRLAGGTYIYDGPLSVKPGTFSLMRNYFSLFGLGVKTGLDVPNESIGYTGSAQEAGNILDFAIGQYDTYTVMQLAQYASTLANGGIKYKPRLVTKAYESGTDSVVWENGVTILGTADNSSAMERIHLGLMECVYGKDGICKGLQNNKTIVAGKTGTAQAYVYEEDKNGNEIVDENGRKNLIQAPNNSVIAYAPAENPELSIACLIPNAWNGEKSQTNLCLEISRRIIQTYYGEDTTLE